MNRPPDLDKPALYPRLFLLGRPLEGEYEIRRGQVEAWGHWEEVVARQEGEVWHVRAGRRQWQQIKENSE